MIQEERNTIETNNNTQEDNEQEIQEDKEQEEEEKSTLRPSVFRPRFGTGQRDAVRNRLRNQLLEGKPNPVTKAPLRSFDELVNEKKRIRHLPFIYNGLGLEPK